MREVSVRVGVIGATGHIGTWLVPMLTGGGHEVLAISRGNRGPYHRFPGWEKAAPLQADRAAMDESGEFGAFIASLDCDVVVDLICFEVASASQIVDALRGRVRHFVHCGTLWVHGNPPTRPYDETIPREPFGNYGIRKAAIERCLLDEASRGFPATILHPGHITGPGWNPINPAGNLDTAVFERLRDGETVTLPDDGSATLQHVHAEDVAQAFDLAIAKPNESLGEAFHVASQAPVTLRQYAEDAAGWFGRSAKLAFLPFEKWNLTVSERDAALTLDHVTHSPHASIEKAERLLGFRPRYSGVDACRSAVLSSEGL